MASRTNSSLSLFRNIELEFPEVSMNIEDSQTSLSSSNVMPSKQSDKQRKTTKIPKIFRNSKNNKEDNKKEKIFSLKKKKRIDNKPKENNKANKAK
jgi:hypothetical protein